MRQKANDDYQVLRCPPTAANGFEACPYSEAIENIRVMHDLCAKCILQSNEVNKNVSAQNARRQTEEHAFRCDPKFQLLVIKSFLTCDYVVDLNARLTTGGEMLGDTLLSPVFVRNFLMLRLLLTGAGQRSVAIRQFTLKEFTNNAVCSDNDGRSCYVVSCANHKTPRLPANIFVDSEELRHMLHLWATHMRPRLFTAGYTADQNRDEYLDQYKDVGSRTFFLSSPSSAPSLLSMSMNRLFRQSL